MRDSDTGRSAAACAGDALANWWAGRESNPNFFIRNPRSGPKRHHALDSASKNCGGMRELNSDLLLRNPRLVALRSCCFHKKCQDQCVVLCRPVPSEVKKMTAMEFAITARLVPG